MLSLIPKLLGFGTAMVGVFWMLLAGIWLGRHYDMLPETPSYTVPIPFIHPKIAPPAKLAPAYVLGESDPNSPNAQALAQCHRNAAALSAALDRQNAATAAISAAGAQALARSETALQRARSATVRASEDELRILGAINTGDPECERYREVDAAFERTLK